MTLPLILGPPLSPAYWKKVGAIQRANLIGYWSNHEPSGTASIDLSPQGNDGVFSNVTLGQPGIGDGFPAASFNGTTSFNNIHSADLNTDFNGAEGTLLSCAKVSAAGIWGDSTTRRMAMLYADPANRIFIGRSAVDNQISLTYFAGGIQENITDISITDVLFHIWVITWSKSGNAVAAYVDGAQTGATQTIAGTWVGDLSSLHTLIGAGTVTPIETWSGGIGPTLLWKTALTGDEAKVASTL